MDFKKAVRKLFASTPSSVLGIDLGSEFVKIAQVELKGSRPEVREFVITELPANLKGAALTTAKDEMAAFLHDLFNRYNFTTKFAVFSINGRNAFVREVGMPEMPDDELKQAVAWDAGQYVPYETDTYYLDYAKFGEVTQEGRQPVVLVATPKDIVDSTLEISDLLGLKVLKFDIDSLTLCRTLSQTLTNFILLDIGHTYSMMTLFQSAAPVAQRALPQGFGDFLETVAVTTGTDVKKAEELVREGSYLKQEGETEELAAKSLKNSINALLRECLLTSDYYASNNREKEFTHIVLAGTGANIPDIAEYVKSRTELEVIRHDVRDAVSFSSKFDGKKVEAAAPALAVAIGAALAGGESDD